MTTSVTVGPPQEFGPIEVWPLCAPESRSQELGWGLDRLRVREAPEPHPNRLLMANPREIPVFLPMGYVIGGLQQTRMLTEDVVVAPGTRLEIPVLCVEAGRFSRPQASRGSGRAPLSVALAGTRPEGSTRASTASCERRQRSVWDAVSRHESRSGARSTHSLEQVMREDLYQRPSQRTVEEALRQRFRVCDGQFGLVAAVAGEPIVLEAFASGELTRAYAADLIRALAFDADGIQILPATPARIQGFIKQIQLPKAKSALHSSGVMTFQGSNGQAIVHGISASPDGYIHLMAINQDHPILRGATL